MSIKKWIHLRPATCLRTRLSVSGVIPRYDAICCCEARLISSRNPLHHIRYSPTLCGELDDMLAFALIHKKQSQQATLHKDHMLAHVARIHQKLTLAYCLSNKFSFHDLHFFVGNRDVVAEASFQYLRHDQK